MQPGDCCEREQPLFAVDLAMKDARHAQSLANKAGAYMKNVEVANEYLKVVKEHMGMRRDIAGIYGAKKVEAGMKV
jgi:3-hydroxyisobutyrate dehydrogenase-like beta-hydroxyacid dehydrogenase